MKLNYDSYIGTFIRRPNRFIAHIDIDGKEVICHVPNTGRLKELLTPGVSVLLSYHSSPTRKTKYELRMIKKKEAWISIDSQLPNALAYEAIASDVIEELIGYTTIKREVTYQNSRFDLQLTDNVNLNYSQQACFVEVKGVTLEHDDWTYFPDAPTERGRKHIGELIHAVNNGHRAVLLFVIQVEYATGFTPNKATDPEFALMVETAFKAGVEVLAYRCKVSPDEVTIVEKIPLVL
ncbi:MAG: DNA/RNA nuclease SfsA [Clostridiales bacterium]|nr:DNA/RNA nuclease SfsA [Clostridiales bacterium]